MRKKVLYLIIIFFTILIELTSISLCDDIDDETVDVLSEIQTSDNIAQNSIKTPDLNSRACVVIDRKSNIILYGKNENEQRKMASTTKIMTSLIIIENCDLKETVEISKKVCTKALELNPQLVEILTENAIKIFLVGEIRNNKFTSCLGNIVYYISKQKLVGELTTMIDDESVENLTSLKKNMLSVSNESMLGKVVGYFFGE